MKKYLLSFIFTSISLIGWSQQTNITWISPDHPSKLSEYYKYTSDKLTIKLNITNPQKRTIAHVEINGKDLKKYTKSNLVPLGKGYFEAEIVIPDNSIQSIVLVLKDHKGEVYQRSEPLLVYRGEIPKPTLYLLAFGPKPDNIDYTDKDAKDFDRAFSRQACGDSPLYDRVIRKNFVLEKANGWQILAEIKKTIALNTIKPNDVFILFASSHGYRIDKEFYIQGHDYTPLAREKTSVSSSELYEVLDPIHAKKIFFIDACKSGKEPNSTPLYKTSKETRLIGYNIMVSSDFNADSYYHEAWENGAFTEVMLEGLKGAADQKNEEEQTDELITTDELFDYLKTGVPELCKNTIENYDRMEQQHPQKIRNELGDVPLFKYDRFCTSFEVFYETIKLPEGKVIVGSLKGETGRTSDEYRDTIIINTPTYMGKYEVTNAEYCEFLNDDKTHLNNYRTWIKISSKYCKIEKIEKKRKTKKKRKTFSPEKGYENMPVVMVSWKGANSFAKWLSEKDCIYNYDLPTANEWEYAARGGPNRPYEIYAGTNNFKDFNTRDEIMPTGSYKRNFLIIHDMSTNVSEWCHNRYEQEPSRREIRGGNFKSTYKTARTAKRYYIFEDEYKEYLGFRLIQRPKKGKECE